ncbi:GtrA family protein [bacterium]|nr:GtrA family protein [bacterium]
MSFLFSKEFITYCIIGFFNTIFGISVAFISLNVFLLGYTLSTLMAYFFGNIVSFFLNKKFTFKNKDKSFFQFIKFFLTMLPAYVISYWLGYKIAHYLSVFFISFLKFLTNLFAIPLERLVDNFAVILSMAIYLFVGFSVNKFFVFKHKN